MNKFLNFLKYHYHRPQAKIEHIIVFFRKLLYNKKTKIFSEKVLLEKNPPSSFLFYNFFGRMFFLIRNYTKIIFFSKFFDKSIYLDLHEKKFLKDSKKKGNNFEPWPPQADHLFENSSSEKIDYQDIYLNYISSCEYLKNKDRFKENKWWESCRNEFNNIFIKNNFINIDNIKNFRNNSKTKAEILSDQNYLLHSNSKKKNQLKSLLIINLYHKLSSFVDLNILRSTSESFSGNNLCINYRGQRLSFRILRYAYYLSQIKTYCSILQNKKNVIIDIGGGYGGLARSLKNYYRNSTIVLIELPELCMLSAYFLKYCFPEKKIGQYNDFKDLKKINISDLHNYDFVLLPPPLLENFSDNSVDLSINTTSLGEMTDEMQFFYIKNIERISRFFYSVNRACPRIEKYNSKGYYDFKFDKKWKMLIYNYTHTYHIEFLGERLDFFDNTGNF